LDAAVGEVSLERNFQQHDWTSGDDSTSCGLPVMVLVSRSSDRNQERRFHAAIPGHRRGNCSCNFGRNAFCSPTIALLSIAALGIYSMYGPFYSLPSEFLTGFAAASGIALVSSLANLGGFAGPYATGWISEKTGVCMADWRLREFPCSCLRR